MSRFCLPRDIYHGKGCLEELKNLKGKKAILVVGGGSMKRQGFLDKAVNYLKEGGMEVQLFEGVEPDPSVETVMKGAEAMRSFRAGLDRMLWVVDHRSMQQKLCGHSMSTRRSTFEDSDHSVQLPGTETESKILLQFRLHPVQLQKLQHSLLSQTIRLV